MSLAAAVAVTKVQASMALLVLAAVVLAETTQMALQEK
jgi:hypothetical protein